MEKINEITSENFQNMFDLEDILKESVFYPASGIDGCDIQFLTDTYCSFIHVDYMYSKDEVEKAMRTDFENVGYDLIGLMDVPANILEPYRFADPQMLFTLNEEESYMINHDVMSRLINAVRFNPSALWAVYELNPNRTGRVEGKIKRFSLLHIVGEACATFEALYLRYKINPKCVVIAENSEGGYTGNWTWFSKPDYTLYQSILRNTQINYAQMLAEVFTDSIWRLDVLRSCNIDIGTPLMNYIYYDLGIHRDRFWNDYQYQFNPDLYCFKNYNWVRFFQRFSRI